MTLKLRASQIAGWLKGARNDQGVAAVEFAYIVPFLAALVVGASDFGAYYYFQMQTRNAAQAGVDYAIKNQYDPQIITAAATDSNPDFTVTPSQFCGCPNLPTGINNVGGSAPNCTSRCSDGKTAGVYVSVKVEKNYTPVLSMAAIHLPSKVTATSIARIK